MKRNIVLLLFLMGLITAGFAASNGINPLASTPSMSVEALQGSAITDLIIHLPSDVPVAKKIQVKDTYPNGTAKFTRSYSNQPVTNGIVVLQFNDMVKGERVDVRVQTDRYGWLSNSTLVVLRPDLAVLNVNAPAQVAPGQSFEVLATISELNRDSGANITVAILENSTVLDTRSMDIAAGSTNAVSFNISLVIAGSHDLAVRIINSAPADNTPGNNEMVFVVQALKVTEPVQYSMNYYYKNTSLNISHYVTTAEYEDNGYELELRNDEIYSITATSTRILSFPVDRIYINIMNETGEGSIYEEYNIIPNEGSGTFKKYYPESNVLLTLRIDANGLTVNVEGKAESYSKSSIGYLHWWFKSPKEWNENTISNTGKFINSKESLFSRMEIEDGYYILGGNAAINIIGQSSTDGWTDTNEGLLVQESSVNIYSGNGSGVTTT